MTRDNKFITKKNQGAIEFKRPSTAALSPLPITNRFGILAAEAMLLRQNDDATEEAHLGRKLLEKGNHSSSRGKQSSRRLIDLQMPPHRGANFFRSTYKQRTNSSGS